MKLDPKSAWQPYRPTQEQPWNRRLAAHLYRRAGFGANAHQLDEALRGGPENAVDQLLTQCDDVADFDADMNRLASTAVAAGDVAGLEPWWLYRMIHTPAPLLDKMMLFWHGHFATSGSKVQKVRLMLSQNALFRRHALGKFEPMVQDVSRDPAMLIYLDSTTNGKVHPNENYAREVMELFCLGIGNYTEKDIQEIGRCFTGWEVRRDKFRFNKYQHDEGKKSFLGESGIFDGDDAVRIILSQPAATRFIARKLVRFFVTDEPLDDAWIEPIAQELRKSDFDVKPALRRILTSQMFFSPMALGRKVRGPVELAMGLLRALEGTTSVNALVQWLRPIGQRLFYPPSVKGWDGGKTWINATTVLGRANLVRDLVDAEATRFAGGTLSKLTSAHDMETGADIVDGLAELLVAAPLPSAARAELIALADSSDPDDDRRVGDIVHALSTLPEFQLA